MKSIWSGILATAAFAATAQAQSPIIQPKLAELQPAKFSVPLCSLKPQGGVSKGVDALKKAYDAKEDRAARLEEAKTKILESVAKENQATNAAAWYYLARVYLMQGDVGGVDSAFTKAQQLQPQCELDIDQYRQNNWAQLANAGLQLQQAGKIDEAIVLFKDASRLFSGLPHVVSNLGVLYANAGKDDSASVYFAKALEISEKGAETDTSLIGDRNSNALNLALMYQRLEKHQEAIPVLKKYLAWDPNNMDARKALSQSLRGAGQKDEAEQLENAMISEMSKQNLDSLDTQDILAIGVASFNAERYPQAAEAFSKAVSRNPYSRDALYNLANAYLAMKANDKLVETAAKLVAIEPMNEDVYRLLGQGHKGLGQDAEVLKAAEKLVGLPVTIDMTGFQMGRTGARLEGTITGRSPTDAQGKAIKPGPLTVVVEFVTTAGTVVDSKEVSVPELAPGASQPLAVDAKGSDIAGWRYHKK
ncbi:MAG: tetratricopeptide repeat protein [Gemmatimonadales bacterium]